MLGVIKKKVQCLESFLKNSLNHIQRKVQFFESHSTKSSISSGHIEKSLVLWVIFKKVELFESFWKKVEFLKSYEKKVQFVESYFLKKN